MERADDNSYYPRPRKRRRRSREEPMENPWGYSGTYHGDHQRGQPPFPANDRPYRSEGFQDFSAATSETFYRQHESYLDERYHGDTSGFPHEFARPLGSEERLYPRTDYPQPDYGLTRLNPPNSYLYRDEPLTTHLPREEPRLGADYLRRSAVAIDSYDHNHRGSFTQVPVNTHTAEIRSQSVDQAPVFNRLGSASLQTRLGPQHQQQHSRSDSPLMASRLEPIHPRPLIARLGPQQDPCSSFAPLRGGHTEEPGGSLARFNPPLIEEQRTLETERVRPITDDTERFLRPLFDDPLSSRFDSFRHEPDVPLSSLFSQHPSQQTSSRLHSSESSIEPSRSAPSFDRERRPSSRSLASEHSKVGVPLSSRSDLPIIGRSSSFSSRDAGDHTSSLGYRSNAAVISDMASSSQKRDVMPLMTSSVKPESKPSKSPVSQSALSSVSGSNNPAAPKRHDYGSSTSKSLRSRSPMEGSLRTRGDGRSPKRSNSSRNSSTVKLQNLRPHRSLSPSKSNDRRSPKYVEKFSPGTKPRPHRSLSPSKSKDRTRHSSKTLPPPVGNLSKPRSTETSSSSSKPSTLIHKTSTPNTFTRHQRKQSSVQATASSEKASVGDDDDDSCTSARTRSFSRKPLVRKPVEKEATVASPANSSPVSSQSQVKVTKPGSASPLKTVSASALSDPLPTNQRQGVSAKDKRLSPASRSLKAKTSNSPRSKQATPSPGKPAASLKQKVSSLQQPQHSTSPSLSGPSCKQHSSSTAIKQEGNTQETVKNTSAKAPPSLKSGADTLETPPPLMAAGRVPPSTGSTARRRSSMVVVKDEADILPGEFSGSESDEEGGLMIDETAAGRSDNDVMDDEDLWTQGGTEVVNNGIEKGLNEVAESAISQWDPRTVKVELVNDSPVSSVQVPSLVAAPLSLNFPLVSPSAVPSEREPETTVSITPLISPKPLFPQSNTNSTPVQHESFSIPQPLPSLVQPSTSLPSLLQPSTSLPSLFQSSTSLPSLFEPSTSLPSLLQPSTSLPSLLQPSTSLPSLFQSSTSLPSLFQPITSLPSLIQPSTSLRSVIQPSKSLPSLFQPSKSLPSLIQPSTSLPSLIQSSTSLPSLIQPSKSLPSPIPVSSQPQVQSSAPPTVPQFLPLPTPSSLPRLVPGQRKSSKLSQTQARIKRKSQLPQKRFLTLPPSAQSQPLTVTASPMESSQEPGSVCSSSQLTRKVINSPHYRHAVNVLGEKLTAKLVKFAQNKTCKFSLLKRLLGKSDSIINMLQTWKKEDGSSMAVEVSALLRERFTGYYTGTIDSVSLPSNRQSLYECELLHMMKRCGHSMDLWKKSVNRYVFLAESMPRRATILRQLRKNSVSTSALDTASRPPVTASLTVPSLIKSDLELASAWESIGVPSSTNTTQHVAGPLTSVQAPPFRAQLFMPPVADRESSILATSDLTPPTTILDSAMECVTSEKKVDVSIETEQEVEKPQTVEKATDTSAEDSLVNIVQKIHAHLARRTDPALLESRKAIEENPAVTTVPLTPTSTDAPSGSVPAKAAIESTNNADGTSCVPIERSKTMPDVNEGNSRTESPEEGKEVANVDLTGEVAHQSARLEATDDLDSLKTSKVVITEAENLEVATTVRAPENGESSKDTKTLISAKELPTDSLQVEERPTDKTTKERSLSPGEIISPTPSPPPPAATSKEAEESSHISFFEDKRSQPYNNSSYHPRDANQYSEHPREATTLRVDRSSVSHESEYYRHDSRDWRSRRRRSSSRERRFRSSTSPRSRPSRSRHRSSQSRSRSRRRCRSRSWSYSRRARRSRSASLERSRTSSRYGGDRRSKEWGDRARSFSSDRRGRQSREQISRERSPTRVSENRRRESEDDLELLELKKAVIISIINKQNEEGNSSAVSEGGVADMDLCDSSSESEKQSDLTSEVPATTASEAECAKETSAKAETDLPLDGPADTLQLQLAGPERSVSNTQQSGNEAPEIKSQVAFTTEQSLSGLETSEDPSPGNLKLAATVPGNSVEERSTDQQVMNDTRSTTLQFPPSRKQSVPRQKKILPRSQPSSQASSRSSSPLPLSKPLTSRRPADLSTKLAQAKKAPTEVLPSQEKTWKIKPFHIISTGTDSEESEEESSNSEECAVNPVTATGQSSIAAQISQMLTEARRESEAKAGGSAPPSSSARTNVLPSPPSRLPPDRQNEYRVLQKKLALHKKQRARAKVKKRRTQQYSKRIAELDLKIKTHRSVLDAEQVHMTSLTEQLTDCETDLEEHELKMALLSDQLLLMREKLQIASNAKRTAELKRLQLQAKVRTAKERMSSCNVAITNSATELTIQKDCLEKLQEALPPPPTTTSTGGRVTECRNLDLDSPSPSGSPSEQTLTSADAPAPLLPMMVAPSLSYVLSPDYECVSDSDSFSADSNGLPSIARVDKLVSPLDTALTKSEGVQEDFRSPKFVDVSPAAYDNVSDAENSVVEEEDTVRRFTDKPPSVGGVRKVLPVTQKAPLVVEPVSDPEECPETPIPLETESVSDCNEIQNGMTQDTTSVETVQANDVMPLAETSKQAAMDIGSQAAVCADIVLKEHNYCRRQTLSERQPVRPSSIEDNKQPVASPKNAAKRSAIEAGLTEVCDVTKPQKKLCLSSDGVKAVQTPQQLQQLISNVIAGIVKQGGMTPTLSNPPPLGLPPSSGSSSPLARPILFPLIPVINAGAVSLSVNQHQVSMETLKSTSTRDEVSTPAAVVSTHRGNTAANPGSSGTQQSSSGDFNTPTRLNSASNPSQPFSLETFCDSALKAALHSSLEGVFAGPPQTRAALNSSAQPVSLGSFSSVVEQQPAVSSLIQNTIKSLTLGDLMSTSVLMSSVTGLLPQTTPAPSNEDRAPLTSELTGPEDSLENLDISVADEPLKEEVELWSNSDDNFIDADNIFLECDNRLFTISPSVPPPHLPLNIFDSDSCDGDQSLEVSPSGIHSPTFDLWKRQFDELTARRKLELESSAVESMKDDLTDPLAQSNSGAFKLVDQSAAKVVKPVSKGKTQLPVLVVKSKDSPKKKASSIKIKKDDGIPRKTSIKPELSEKSKSKSASNTSSTALAPLSKHPAQSGKNLQKDIEAVQEQLQQLKDQLVQKIAQSSGQPKSSKAKKSEQSSSKHSHVTCTTAASVVKATIVQKSLSSGSSSKPTVVRKSDDLAVKSIGSKPGLAKSKLASDSSKPASQLAVVQKSSNSKLTASESAKPASDGSRRTSVVVKNPVLDTSSSRPATVPKSVSNAASRGTSKLTLPTLLLKAVSDSSKKSTTTESGSAGVASLSDTVLKRISKECKMTYGEIKKLQATISTHSHSDLSFVELLRSVRPNSSQSVAVWSVPNSESSILIPKSFCDQQMEKTRERKKSEHQSSMAGYESYVSPLLQFQSHRLGAISRTATTETVKALLNSPQCDPQRIMCRFELLGTCNDPNCTAQHFKDCKKKQNATGRAPPLQNISKKQPASASSVAVATTSSAMEKEPFEEVVPLQPNEDSSSRQIPRYFTTPDADSLASLNERVQLSPNDYKAWVKLADRAWQESGTERSHTYLRALKSCPKSEQLWVEYLKAKHAEVKGSSEMAVIHHKAIDETNSYAVIFECVRQSQSFDDKHSFMVRGLHLLREQSRNVHPPNPSTSHQCLELLLNIALLHRVHGKTQGALFSLQQYLFITASSAKVSSILTLSDKQTACLSLVYLVYCGQLPSVLFDCPSGHHPARLVAKELYELHWNSETTLSDVKYEAIRKLFKASIRLCVEASPQHPLQDSAQLCLPLHRNLVMFTAKHRSCQEAIDTCKHLVSTSPNCVELWLLYLKICDKETARDKVEVAIQMCPPQSPELYYAAACMELSRATPLAEGQKMEEEGEEEEGGAKEPSQAAVARAVDWLKKCVGRFYQSLEDTGSLSVADVHLLYRKLLSQLVPYDHKTPAFAEGVVPGKLGKMAAPMWTCYSLLVKLTLPSVPRGSFFHGSVEEVFESAVHSIQTRESYVALWRAYLSHARRLTAEKGTVASFKLYSECVQRSVMAVEVQRSHPSALYGQPESYEDYGFQNEVVEALLSSLPLATDYTLAILRKFVKLFPRNPIMVARLVECMLEGSSEYTEQAQSTLAAFLAREPQCSVLWRMAIAIEVKLKHSKQARWMFHQALSALPLHARLWKEFLMFEFGELATSSSSVSLFVAAVNKAVESGIDASALFS